MCVHNSARSQMAEAFVNRWCHDDFVAYSAGLEPGVLNPLAVTVMQELGIDISRNRTKSVHDLAKTGKSYDYVVTVCDEASAEQCPIFPGKSKRLHWSFPDPAAVAGSDATKLSATREIRNQIRRQIALWCKKACKTRRHTAPEDTYTP